MTRSILYVQVGGTGGADWNRTVASPWLQPGGSVAKFVRNEVEPAIDACKPDAAMLWSAQGLTPGEHAIDADGVIEAREQGLPHLVNGFAAAWRRVTARMEVIKYGGTLHMDPDFAGLELPQWLRRVATSYEPYLDAGMSIAFDVGAMIDLKDASRYDDKTARLIQLFNAAGVRTYLEPWWFPGAEWGFGMPVILTEQYWQMLKRQPEWPVFARRPEPGMPEVIRILNVIPPGATGFGDVKGYHVRDWMDSCREDGHSPAVGMEWYRLAVGA